MYICGDYFEQLADFSFGGYLPHYKSNRIELSLSILDNFIINFKKNRLPIIYVNSDRVIDFFNIVKDYDKLFILISHNGDYTFTDGSIPNCIKYWYGQNINFEHDKIKHIPIGMERIGWFPELKKRDKLDEYRQFDRKPSKLLYLNVNPDTNSDKRRWLFDYFRQYSFCTIKHNVGYDEYLSDICDHYYVLCPQGNGLDTHRTSEVLYMNRTPVLLTNIMNIRLYDDALFVKDYTEITEEYLLNNIRLTHNIEKIKKDYYETIRC